MRLLLDSHALLWYALDDPQLSPTARAAILEPANEVLISPASLWELAINAAHTAQVATLPFHAGHRDPFDRLIIAQAMVDRLNVVSRDAAFDSYGIQRIW